MGKLFRIPKLAGKHPRHKVHGVVRLQVGRLVADYSVGRGVRLVETVACELLQNIEDLVRLLLVDVVGFLGSLHENLSLLGHLLGLLLSHGSPENVCTA